MMARWYEHPSTNKFLEGEQVLNVLNFLNEAKESFIKQYGDPNSKLNPLESIIKIWPDKSSTKKEWLRRVIDNGPMHDKIQSMGTIICEFPMHSMFYIDNLISLVNLSKKRFAVIASDLLTNLFITFLLPKSRPLINLNERPLASLNNMKEKKIAVREKILTYWYFEEQLKGRYFRFIKALEEMIKSEADQANKIQMINLCFKLCRSKENQSLLLDVMVNKLGDLNSKVTGCVFSKLKDLGFNDRSMMPKIVRSIRRFVFRPNLSKKAQYYAVQLLVQSYIDKKHLNVVPGDDVDDENGDGVETIDSNIAVQMIQIYIGIFKRLIDGSKTKCEKLYSALMNGLSRALPYTKGVDVQKYTDSVFQLVHSCNINLSIHGLKVLYSIVTTKTDSDTADNQKNLDRYLRLVYGTVLNPRIFFNSQKVSFINIFFKSVVTDTDTVRVKAMVKRLLQMCLHHPEPGFVCVCLLFLSRLVKSVHGSIFEKLQKPTSNETVQVKVPVIHADTPSNIVAVESDSEGEEIADILSDDDRAADNEESAPVDAAAATVSWVHTKKSIDENPKSIYDPYGRNPKYCNVESEHLIELTMLSDHYHPSVRIFVESILKGERIVYKSDPSEDLSLIKFLDKFAYKNPKKLDDKRKVLPGTAPGKINNETDEIRKMVVNTKSFADLKEQKVPIDELFFHKYFNHAKKNNLKKVVDEDVDSDFQDSDTEFDKFLMKDDLNMSGSEMGDEDEEVEFSDMSDDSIDCDVEEDGDFEMDSDGNDGGNDHEEIANELNLYDDDEIEEIGDDEMMIDSDEGDVEDEDEDDEEEETIHSSKRKRLGEEISNITTGAMTLGRSFQNIKDKAAENIKEIRKKRKRSKNKGQKVHGQNQQNFKVKLGKRKFKK